MPTEEMLRKYARVAVEVGLGVENGDRVVIEVPVQLPEFTRLLSEAAYDAGAVSVDAIFFDDLVSRARFTHGSEEAANVVTGRSEFRLRGYETGASYLRVHAEDPAALAGVDTSRVQASQRVNGEFLKPHFDAMGSLQIPWTVIGAPLPAWNETVFPGVEATEAEERMWEAIFRACRIDRDDPVHAWQLHIDELGARKRHLTEQRYEKLRYEGPGTGLVLGMTDGVKWQGGGVRTPQGRPFLPNIPTEEVFTSPHRKKADGRIQASKPLSYFGDLIEGFAFEVSEGRVVGATAEKGQDVLDRILDTDEGSVRFGEAAMVPQAGAVAAEGLVWNNMLFDENDACHIALGQSYASCFDGAENLTPDEQVEAGLNRSNVHVDFVVGSSELSVYGVGGDGSEELIISKGEWGFSV